MPIQSKLCRSRAPFADSGKKGYFADDDDKMPIVGKKMAIRNDLPIPTARPIIGIFGRNGLWALEMPIQNEKCQSRLQVA